MKKFLKHAIFPIFLLFILGVTYIIVWASFPPKVISIEYKNYNPAIQKKFDVLILNTHFNYRKYTFDYPDDYCDPHPSWIKYFSYCVIRSNELRPLANYMNEKFFFVQEEIK